MYLKYTIIIIIIFISYSCKTHTSFSPEVNLIVAPSPANLVTNLAPYIDTLVLIPLETTEQSLITNVFKMLLLPDHRFILLNGRKILVFNPEGNYLRTIGTPGRGPEEYSGIYDFCLSQNNQEIYLLSQTGEIVIYKTRNGKFVRKINPEKNKDQQEYNAIASGANNSFFLFKSEPETVKKFSPDFYCLHHLDSLGKIQHSYLLRDDYNPDFNTISQSYDNRSILRPYNNSQTCYLLQDSIPVPYFKIDFGDQNIPHRYSSDLNIFYNSHYCKLPMRIYDTKDHIYFTFMGPAYELYTCISSLASGTTITWNSSGEDQHNPFEILGSDREFLYGLYTDYRPLNEISLTETEPLKKAIIQKSGIQLKEDNNPCLVKIRLKF